ncbi:unnamed protein product, partial [Prorocentrum cordatum]
TFWLSPPRRTLRPAQVRARQRLSARRPPLPARPPLAARRCRGRGRGMRRTVRCAPSRSTTRTWPPRRASAATACASSARSASPR